MFHNVRYIEEPFSPQSVEDETTKKIFTFLYASLKNFYFVQKRYFKGKASQCFLQYETSEAMNMALRRMYSIFPVRAEIRNGKRGNRTVYSFLVAIDEEQFFVDCELSTSKYLKKSKRN